MVFHVCSDLCCKNFGVFFVYAEFFMKTLSPWNVCFLLFLEMYASCCSYPVIMMLVQVLISHWYIFLCSHFPYSWSSWKQWWRHTVDHHHHTCGRTYRDLQNDWQRSSRVTITFIQGPTRVSKVQTMRFCVSCVVPVISNTASHILSLFFTYWLSVPLRLSQNICLCRAVEKRELHTILWVLGEITKCISYCG